MVAAEPGSQAMRQVSQVVEKNRSVEEEVRDEKGMQRECATRVPRVTTMAGIWNVVSAGQNAKSVSTRSNYSPPTSHGLHP